MDLTSVYKSTVHKGMGTGRILFTVAGIRFKMFTLLHIVFPLGTRIGRHIWYIASAVHGDISQPRSEHFCFEKITSLTTISATPSKMSNECDKD
ncbi:unnamed protein product [Porites lobata]|uniref:Uncharacterized protein n=1 Tax=Porites lobata TaxID=104759 RepID=A0ABN8QHT2_9CNID|nr:unnamed protein product [Porites lobata]